MYTYIQPHAKKYVMYVHTSGLLNAYSRIHTARARVHGEAATASCSSAANRLGPNREIASSCSSGGNGMHHVHREPTGLDGTADRNEAWCTGWKHRSKRGLAYRKTEETALCSTGHDRNGILFIGRGVAYRKTEETDFSWTSYGRNGVLLVGRGVAYRKTEETDL